MSTAHPRPRGASPVAATLKTPGSAHASIDVAGFCVKPLYASTDPSGDIHQGTASGVVSSTHRHRPLRDQLRP